MKKQITPTIIGGETARGFDKVSRVFEKIFSEHGELGASVAVYFRGQKVVDLWGGVKDVSTRQPWQADTLCPVFSTTKGVSALTIALAVSKGLLSYDMRIAECWPEFALNGKESITLRQLLNHQAGLSRVDEVLSMPILADPDTLAKILARQTPAWTPGAYQGYHCWTQGFYLSEIIRRADPKKRRLGVYFREEIAEPLGLDFYIGLPDEVPDERIANLLPFHPVELALNMDKMPAGMVLSLMNPFSLPSRSMMNPPVCAKHNNFNKREVRSLEIPSGNGIGSARAIAKLYGEFAGGGKALRINPQVIDKLEGPAVAPACGHFKDLVFKMDMPFSYGVWKPWPRFPFAGGRGYGVWGAGGSCGFADPAHQLGFAYVPNKMGLFPMDDPREHYLRTAVYECIKEM